MSHWARRRPDFDDLRRRANANLARVFSGEVKREEERKRQNARDLKEARREHRRDLHNERQQINVNLKKWRKERRDLEKEAAPLYQMNDEGTIHGEKKSGGFDLYAYLEEIDARISTLIGKENEAEDRKMMINWEMRR